MVIVKVEIVGQIIFDQGISSVGIILIQPSLFKWVCTGSPLIIGIAGTVFVTKVQLVNQAVNDFERRGDIDNNPSALPEIFV